MGAVGTKALQMLPKMDDLLARLAGDERCAILAKPILRKVCQGVVEDKRQELLASQETDISKEKLREAVISAVVSKVEELFTPRLRKVVNATGVVLHTNLGRAPLSSGALYSLMLTAVGYSNLEFSLADGQRGSRYDNIRELACLITGAEDVVVVNNNAAAVMLVLDTLANGKEAIVSRGELVEIGGGFRIPEVMQKSGAILKEVGTTNRTRIGDYKKAFNENTAMLMKVHTSNFKMVGFCEDTPLADLVAFGKERGVPVYYDLGSGSLFDLRRYGIEGEPVIAEVLASGVDVVSVSGDKLLGGPQAGIIFGKREAISAIRQNPLNRALRVDKLTLSALEGTLTDYLLDEGGVHEAIYSVRYISRDLAYLKKAARRLAKKIGAECVEAFSLSIIAGKSFAGGGALPEYELESVLVALRHPTLTAEAIATLLRLGDTPVIVRVANDEVLFDLRTLEEDEYPQIASALKRLIENGQAANG